MTAVARFCPDEFFTRQVEVWPAVKQHYRELAQALTRRVVTPTGRCVTLMWLPGRARSSGAKIDAASVAARPCFLCGNNRPPEQIAAPWAGRYLILLNPYPIFSPHFTIVDQCHTPQTLTASRLDDMWLLAAEMKGYTVFFNGAACGASAPDHFHFQAVPSHCLPLWDGMHTICNSPREIEALVPFESQHMVNLLVRSLPDGRMECALFCRRLHRPSCWPSRMVSPGAIDMAGCLVLPIEKDFLELDGHTIDVIYSEVTA